MKLIQDTTTNNPEGSNYSELFCEKDDIVDIDLMEDSR